ncbi:MAG: APC family permease [Bacteroidales bacterium]|nr:APC family permease [Bacteroidales bacterium]
MTNNLRSKSLIHSFSIISSISVVVGIVVGIGIFRLPSIVAGNSANELQFILFWVAGGFISLMGALCYAELSSSMPDTGGEYFFLRKAFGPATGFFFSWGRMTVIQTGSIVIVSFILGDYATLVFDLGTYSSHIYAALTIIALTSINMIGTPHSRQTQNILTYLIVSGILVLVVAAFIYMPSTENANMDLSLKNNPLFSGGAPGLAMIFVLLTFGGWNEAAYIAGEIKNVQKNIVKVLVFGILCITTLYVLINLAYLHVLGFETLKNSTTVGHDLTQAVFGSKGSLIIVIIVIISALSTANATIMTGARTNYAIGRDFKIFKPMGVWHPNRNSPVNALLVQGIIALILVGIGALSKQGISTMVDYTAPVFWFFLLLITLSVFVFRYKKQHIKGSYKIPFFPLPPLLFFLACSYMLYSSLAYTGTGALLGVGILAAGIPVWLLSQKGGN